MLPYQENMKSEFYLHKEIPCVCVAGVGILIDLCFFIAFDDVVQCVGDFESFLYTKYPHHFKQLQEKSFPYSKKVPCITVYA